MKLKEFIQMQIEAMTNNNIVKAEFVVHLNNEGIVDNTSFTTVRFTVEI